MIGQIAAALALLVGALCAGGTFAFLVGCGVCAIGFGVVVGVAAIDAEDRSAAVLGALAGVMLLAGGLGGFYLMIPALVEAM